MRILLDSHAFVWFLLGHPRCGPKVRDLIEQGDTSAFVSAATAWEIAIKVRLGKWPEATTIVHNMAAIIADHDFSPLPVSVAHGAAAGLLPGTHKDPFGRMLAAQSLIEALPLVTTDREASQVRHRDDLVIVISRTPTACNHLRPSRDTCA